MPRKGMIAALTTLVFLSTAAADYETMNIFGGVALGFGTGGKLYRSENTSTAQPDVKDRFFNYGSGLKFDIGCQYFIMDKISLQGSLYYSAGVPAFREIDQTAAVKNTTTFGYSMYGLKLHIIPKFQVLDLLDTYVGVGTGLYFTSCSIDVTRETTNATQSAKSSLASFPSLGFSGLFGVDYPLNDKMTLFGELSFEQISFNLDKLKVKESNIVGVTAGTVYNYEKNALGNNNLNPEKIPGSNFQIRFGVRYALF